MIYSFARCLPHASTVTTECGAWLSNQVNVAVVLRASLQMSSRKKLSPSLNAAGDGRRDGFALWGACGRRA